MPMCTSDNRAFVVRSVYACSQVVSLNRLRKDEQLPGSRPERHDTLFGVYSSLVSIQGAGSDKRKDETYC